ARPRDIQILELEDLEPDRAIAPRQPEADVDRIEFTALGIRARPARDIQVAVRGDAVEVESVDAQIAAELPERRQLSQTTTSLAPQPLQNSAPTGGSWPQCGQVAMREPDCTPNPQPVSRARVKT